MLESLLFVYQTSQSEYAFRLGVNTFQEEESKREERVRTEDKIGTSQKLVLQLEREMTTLVASLSSFLYLHDSTIPRA